MGPGIKLVGDLSHKLFEDIFDGNNSFRSSPFIDDDGHVDLFAPKILEEMGDFFRFWGIEDRFNEFLDGSFHELGSI